MSVHQRDERLVERFVPVQRKSVGEGLHRTGGGDVEIPDRLVRGVLIRGAYRPRAALRPAGPAGDLTAAVAEGTLTAQQLLERYAALVYTQTGENVSETARRLQLDRRTVRRYVTAARKAAADG